MIIFLNKTPYFKPIDYLYPKEDLDRSEKFYMDNAEDEKPSAILMSAARRELAEYWMGMGGSLTPSKYSLVAYGAKKDSVMVPLGESALSVREKSFSSMASYVFVYTYILFKFKSENNK